ncbi:MAG: hypothetical protein OXJ62_09375 [Spirochaetaceae bacterium]|nr:hypothetical protein [Spirochaetaceae bacterium]
MQRHRIERAGPSGNPPLEQFPDCSFWRLDDIGIAVRDRYGFQIVGLIQRRPPPPEGVPRSEGTL